MVKDANTADDRWQSCQYDQRDRRQILTLISIQTDNRRLTATEDNMTIPMALTSFQTTTREQALEHFRMVLEEQERARKVEEQAKSYHSFIKDWLSSASKLKPDAWEQIFPPNLWDEHHCGCGLCTEDREKSMTLEQRLTSRRMIVCPNCGNKRCPHARDHKFRCTHSNQPEQVGTLRFVG